MKLQQYFKKILPKTLHDIFLQHFLKDFGKIVSQYYNNIAFYIAKPCSWNINSNIAQEYLRDVSWNMFGNIYLQKTKKIFGTKVRPIKKTPYFFMQKIKNSKLTIRWTVLIQHLKASDIKTAHFPSCGCNMPISKQNASKPSDLSLKRHGYTVRKKGMSLILRRTSYGTSFGGVRISGVKNRRDVTHIFSRWHSSHRGMTLIPRGMTLISPRNVSHPARDEVGGMRWRG